MAEHFEYRLIVSFLVAFYSGLPGLWLTEIVKKRNSNLFNAVRNFELTSNAQVYKFLQIDFFVYLIKSTFFKRFNTKIKIAKRPGADEVNNLLNEMTISELCHVFGFVFVLIFQIAVVAASTAFDVLLFSTIFNIIFNVYPVLLQERNKLRLKGLSTALRK